MPEEIMPVLNDILIAVLIGVAGYVVAWLTGRLFKRVLPRFMNDSWTGFLSNVAMLGIGLLTIKIIVDRTGWAGTFVVVVTAITGAFAIGSERLAADLANYFAPDPPSDDPGRDGRHYLDFQQFQCDLLHFSGRSFWTH